MTPEQRKKFESWARELKPLLLMIVLLLSFRSAIADWNHVPTGSMKPTIVEGDRIAINKLAYGLKLPFSRITVTEWADPQRGEVVVFWSPADEKRYVKRVIGTPGDRIEMHDNQLYVNGECIQLDIDSSELGSLRESMGERSWNIAHAQNYSATPEFGPVIVPERRYFVMGDNRDDSLDSRAFGFVDRDRVVGRAVGVAMSLDAERWYLPRWGRFFVGVESSSD